MKWPGKSKTHLHNQTTSGYSNMLLWIPNRIQILDDEKADKKACEAIMSSEAIILTYFTLYDSKAIIRVIYSNMWRHQSIHRN